MKLKVYLLILLVIFATSTASALLLFFYMNIETNPTLGYVAMGIACLLSGSSFLGLFLYAFKRIYYRGETYVYMVHSSLRQGMLVTLGSLTGVAFYSLGVLNEKTGFLLFVLVLLFELMIQSVSEN